MRTVSNAAKCRKNGWVPGTVLEGDEGYGPERILITAIGEESILARRLSDRHGAVEDSESLWTLEYRNWRKVALPDARKK